MSDLFMFILGLVELVFVFLAIRWVVRRFPVVGTVLWILLAVVTLGLIRAPTPGPMSD